MALRNYSRVDGRKSYSYCSTVTVVIFSGLCLVGVWMLMSSSIVPTQNSEVSNQKRTPELEDKILEKKSRPFEDSPGDLPEDATKGEDSPKDNEDESNSGVKVRQTLPENESEHRIDETSKEKYEKEGMEGKSKNEEELKGAVENDGDRKMEESDLNSDAESNSGNVENSSDGGDSNTGDGDVNSDDGEMSTERGETSTSGQSESEDSPNTVENSDEIKQEDEIDGRTDEKIEVKKNQDSEASSGEKKMENQDKGPANEMFPSGAQTEILNETTTQNGPWSTQAVESKNEKESQKSLLSSDNTEFKWKVCNVSAGPDYIPCLDNVKIIRKLPSTMHYEHRERHCPDEAPTCLVSLPEGYKRSIKWPKSREKIWYNNVPHTKLAAIKGHQNWVKVTGDYLNFPGGGTQFKNGALHYIDFIQKSLPEIAWGKRSRVILDVGCGVASFGGYLFERDVLAMSFAPKDEHEAQVQFALERGIPAISAVMGTKRLPFPSKVFDIVHCARCRVPWHIEGGKLILELNRLLRPGGYFVWSATPVYRKGPEDSGIWRAMSALTKSMCWDLVAIEKDKLNEVGAAIYRKPTSNECYEKRPKNEPPLCEESDDPDAAWNVLLQACLHKAPTGTKERASQWPEQWPLRVEKAPSWLKSSQVGVYGRGAPEDFTEDYKHWKHVVSKSYLTGMGISWSSVRNIMDMKAVYGGFAAALKDLNAWVMNIVPVNSPDTLPIIFDRGLFGIYHDWCESFSTYPRTYDLLHADHLFSDVKKRCKILPVIAEVDRILRPEGHLIVRDKVDIISEVEKLAKSLQWKIRQTYSKDGEGLLCIQKTFWRPLEAETIMSAIE